jgi:ABC-2 type transport system permease protein
VTDRTFTVALSEFTTLSRSKAFLLGLLLMPVIVLVAFGVQMLTKNSSDVKDRAFVVIDGTGVLYAPLQAAAEEWNRTAASGAGAQKEPRYLPSEARLDPGDEQARATLSDRVRRGEIFAFVEIPAAALDSSSAATVKYYSNHPAYHPLPAWIGATINREIVNRRFRDAGIDRALVSRLTERVPVSELGLLQRGPRGAIKAAARVDQVRTLVIPAVMMMVVLFSVMSAAPQLLNSVMEEKMSRISEVLIGSITPFELMMGKLLGSTAVSLLLASVYIIGGTALARHYGYGDAVHASDIVWLIAFLTMAVFMFGSIFISIGAACSDLKDAQGMMTPAMIFMMVPWMTWFSVVRAPDSPMSVGLSLFPSATPFLMMLRMALPPGPPAWQVALSFVLTGATAVLVVHAAGKIFRTGILMQGKAATLGEMWKWVRAD